MEWILKSPQIHSTFGNLGFNHTVGYHANANCNSVLESILHNILIEDKYLRGYRRSISLGQNLKKDLIPLLIHAKDDKTIELLIRILVNLTIPIECLLSVDLISKTDFGRQTVYELNNLLITTKHAFTDYKVTKVVIEFLKKNFEFEKAAPLSHEQCTNISNSLLLLRNILHIPEESTTGNQNHNRPGHTVQNQILWNIFSQSIDKVLIKLMNIPEATNWGVTMVQLIAVLYKDQHVVTLHKLLNQWLETSLTESSEDNESNTYLPDRGSHDSSPMLTSDPTSDSSDNGGSGKCNPENDVWPALDVVPTLNIADEADIADWAEGADGADRADGGAGDAAIATVDYTSGEPAAAAKDGCSHLLKPDNGMSMSASSSSSGDSMEDAGEGGVCAPTDAVSRDETCNDGKQTMHCETSDCGYGTQIENQGSVSTSSNEDDIPPKKPVHQKPHNPKQRTPKARHNTHPTAQDKKRKKIVKRAKANIINVQGLSHNTPTDDDITNILKEFTVDFLLKGYNSLVRTLHSQILTNMQLEIDTSHFFWLVTYFLKFATQIELDLEHVCSVLSIDIVSYLTAEGVHLCEQFELAIKLDGTDLKPSIRRLHLLVTAIREFVQAIESYKKGAHVSSEALAALEQLQLQVGELRELRGLLLLLLRHYCPRLHSRQYLQDLIVTNHILLLFVDNVMKMPEYTGPKDMHDHLMQFATPKIMHQYGIILESYRENGEFVNDCIFTVMHHVGGELDSLIALFQPKILKSFTSIWETEFEICDDWSDLIEHVINTFIKKPDTLQMERNFRLKTESFEGEDAPPATDDTGDKWTKEELSTLNWNYMQSNTSADFIGDIVDMFKEDGLDKSRHSVIKELYRQSIINKEDYDRLMAPESDNTFKTWPMTKEAKDSEIRKLCEQLIEDGRIKSLEWVQKVLLETCLVKIRMNKQSVKSPEETYMDEHNIMQFELFKKKPEATPVMPPVAYHCLAAGKSVPLVPWNCAQADVTIDLKFLQLLHKLGFGMPVDSGMLYIRIPYFWTPDILYDIAGKILPVDTSKLEFSLSDISRMSVDNMVCKSVAGRVDTAPPPTPGPPNNFYQVHKQNHLATMVNFTPKPGTSFTCEELVKVESQQPLWLEVVKRSQEMKITLIPRVETPAALPEADDNISVCATASVASDLTHMYVSDEDEKPKALPIAGAPARPLQLKPAPKPEPARQPAPEPAPPHPRRRAGKRARVHFSTNS